jgi:5-methylthioadenosine/S-adenosylhomocysteine deaminase
LSRCLIRTSWTLPDAYSEATRDATILVEGDRVESVGTHEAVRRAYPLAREHDRRGLVALPALVDAHSHGRGLPVSAQGVDGGPLELFLARLTACTPVDPRDDALVAAGDLLRTGVAAVQVFFHSFGDAIAYGRAAEATAAGLAAAGIEFELVLGITDRDEFVPARAGAVPREARALVSPERGLGPHEFFELFDALAERWESVPTLGPVAPQWCSDAIWRGVARRARAGVRVHTHLLESRAQRAADPFGTLVRFGVLGPGLSAAHAVWLADAELARAAAAGATLVHCPGSNRRLGVGTARVRRWLDAGVGAAFGLDSLASTEPADAFADLRLAREASALTGREALALATIGGARALGRPGLGRIAAGSAANLLLLPASSADEGGDALGALLTRASREQVREAWVRGTCVLADGVLVNEAEVETARRRLLRQLAADAEARAARLAAVAAAEPWLRRESGLDTG